MVPVRKIVRTPMGRPMVRPRRLVLLFALLVVGGLVVTSNTAGKRNDQDIEDNQTFGVLYKGDGQRDCWRHHKPEGMVDSHIVVPLFPRQVKLGEPADLNLQIENPWINEITAYRVVLNLTKAPGIRALIGQQAESPPPLYKDATGRIGNAGFYEKLPPGTRPLGTWENVTFNVTGEPLTLFARFDFTSGPGDPGDPPQGFPELLKIFVFPPGSSSAIAMDQGDRGYGLPYRTLTLPKGEGTGFVNLVPGPWRFQVHYESGDAPYADWRFNATAVLRGATIGEFEVYKFARDPPELETKPNIVYVGKKGVLDLPAIPIVGFALGEQEIKVMVEANLYYKHKGGGQPDEDYFRRVAVVQVPVGDTFIESSEEGAVAGVALVDFRLMAGEVTGFASAILLLPSLLFGGTYGKASRKAFNAMLGGAKRRVMFHNLLSLGLTLVAILHIVLFLLEVRYSVLMGVLWGGLGALSLLVLGLSGYYQVPLIQKYGYNWWRYTHLAFGILVVVFVALHTVLDGADFFDPVEAKLPQWLQTFNLVDK